MLESNRYFETWTEGFSKETENVVRNVNRLFQGWVYLHPMLTYPTTVNDLEYTPHIKSLETSEEFKEIYDSITRGESSNKTITKEDKNGILQSYNYHWKKVSIFFSFISRNAKFSKYFPLYQYFLNRSFHKRMHKSLVIYLEQNVFVFHVMKSVLQPLTLLDLNLRQPFRKCL